MKFVSRLFIALASAGIFASNSHACSYYINKDEKGQELREIALAAVKKGQADTVIKAAEVSEFSFFESKPTPMCPQEITYDADISIHYTVTGPAGYQSNCHGVVHVKKVEPWTNNTNPVQYEVSGTNLFSCTR